MKEFDLHTTATAPEGSKDILAQAEKQSGFIPYLYAIMAEAPEVLKPYTHFEQMIDKTSVANTEVFVTNCF
ncbi:MAG: hypothetical protein ACUVQ1_09500 [Candidatus Kapaibacteriales bacterium]